MLRLALLMPCHAAMLPLFTLLMHAAPQRRDAACRALSRAIWCAIALLRRASAPRARYAKILPWCVSAMLRRDAWCCRPMPRLRWRLWCRAYTLFLTRARQWCAARSRALRFFFLLLLLFFLLHCIISLSSFLLHWISLFIVGIKY